MASRAVDRLSIDACYRGRAVQRPLAMTEAELTDVLRARLAKCEGYPEGHALLRKFKDAGGGQQTAYRVLEALREHADDETEDVILELMDAVIGWCSPQQTIWDAYLET